MTQRSVPADREGGSAARPVRPFYFGEPGRELFGVLNPGAGEAAKPPVLLCAPFGQEAIRAYRTFRVLAERLARAGRTTLRFHYFGSGDSAGDDTAFSFEGMCADIAAANERLLAETGGGSAIWIGLGLGATAAWRAAARADRPPARLMMWDPVLDGASYLDMLARRHAETVTEAYDGAPPATSGAFTEALGFAVTPAFAAELRALDLAATPLAATTRATLITRSAATDDPRSAALQVERIVLTHDIDWTSETADAGAVVPGAAIVELAALAGKDQ